jgi:hypothetical protein
MVSDADMRDGITSRLSDAANGAEEARRWLVWANQHTGEIWSMDHVTLRAWLTEKLMAANSAPPVVPAP